MNHDMDNTQTENALARLFNEEDNRIVFWNDPENEFTITLPLLNLPEGVNILDVILFTHQVKNPITNPTGSWTSVSTAAVSGPTGHPFSWTS
ncbi:MAG: hypothetical protein JRH05_09925 [Deltaproteobacteria bacterium]|nr:hypothetical protein [Deltaproteobacteria bacterium]